MTEKTEFCRGCLKPGDIPEFMFHYSEKNRRLFVYSTGLQVKRNDYFVFQLCKECYMNMKIACKFKKQCRSIDKKMKNYLTLKEHANNLEFSAFLKQLDDSFTFRSRMLNGSSTPAVQRQREDDNESTCTSIRNFMTDILQDQEIPETEAQIIQEVINEEADIFDDSLDSVWMQDEPSIDTDFRALSASPFATPRSIVNDHFYTPLRYNTEQMKDPTQKHHYVSRELIDQVKIKNKTIFEDDLLEFINKENVHENNVSGDHVFLKPKKVVLITDHESEVAVINPKDEIDRKLEELLQQGDAKEISLDELLAVSTGQPPPLTPTLTNIIYGSEYEPTLENNLGQLYIDQCIERCEEIQGMDVLENFLKESNDETDQEGVIDYDLILDVTQMEEIEVPDTFDKIIKEIIDAEYDEDEKIYKILKLYCKKCNKEFKLAKGLKTHCATVHKVKIPSYSQVQKNNRAKKVCEHCGKEFLNGPEFYTHKKRHATQKNIVCPKCELTFADQSHLTVHLRSHGIIPSPMNQKPKRVYICAICGKEMHDSSNLKRHIRRHNKEYKHRCTECGKGFYSQADFTTHVNRHVGVKAHQCPHCDKSFYTRSLLVVHMRQWHLGTVERRFECDRCGRKFVRKALMLRHIRESKQLCFRIENGLYKRKRPSKKKKKKGGAVKRKLDNNKEESGVEIVNQNTDVIMEFDEVD